MGVRLIHGEEEKRLFWGSVDEWWWVSQRLEEMQKRSTVAAYEEGQCERF